MEINPTHKAIIAILSIISITIVEVLALVKGHDGASLALAWVAITVIVSVLCNLRLNFNRSLAVKAETKERNNEDPNN